MTGCKCYITISPPVKWLGYRGVESSRGGYELRSGFGPAWVRIQPICQKKTALQKRARAAGSTVPDGSGPASCRNRVRLSPSCAVAGHSAATGSVESPQKLSGFEVEQGSSRPWDSRRLSSVRISCVGASETMTPPSMMMDRRNISLTMCMSWVVIRIV